MTEVENSHIELVKSGNTEAWNFVRKNFEAGLRSRAAQLLRNSGLDEHVGADDLVQETWLKAWNKRESFRGETVPQYVKWLLTILKNTFIDKHRKRPFELSAPAALANAIGPSKTPSENVRMAERDSSLIANLEKLDSLTRVIITLKHFKGLTFREIADRVGKNPNSVASIYRRAMVRLKSKLTDGSSASAIS